MGKKIVILLILNYFILLLFSVFLEISILGRTATDVQNLMSLSADMAIMQLQAADEVFTAVSAQDDVTTIKVAGSTSFVPEPLSIFAFDVNRKEAFFRRQFQGNDFEEWLEIAKVKTMELPYVGTGGTIALAEVPVVLQMGEEVVGSLGAPQELIHTYGFDRAEQTFDGGGTFFRTPISLGLTYFNSELLGALFMSNVDLLMRGHFSNISQGEGLLHTGFGDTELLDYSGAPFHAINNGRFSVLRGGLRAISGSASNPLLLGTQSVDIEYKLINTADPAYDEMLLYLFSKDSAVFSSLGVVEYIIVAKMEFTLDVLPPIFSPFLRELAINVGGGRYAETGSWGTYTMHYTRFFAIDM